MKTCVLVFLLLVCVSALAQKPIPGDTPTNSLDARIKALEERVIALEAELKTLRGAQSVRPAPALTTNTIPTQAEANSIPSASTETIKQAGPLPNYGAASVLSKVLNPDISVVGDFIGSAGRNPVSAVPSLEMHESEVGFQAVVDPYARGDFFLSFGEEGVSLEEGYATFTSLPGGFVAKVGKMRAAFGKVNTLHNHVLPWTDRPLVAENLTGGEDGINDAGFSVTRILPSPSSKLFLEGTGQVFRGTSGDVFEASRKREVSVIGHLRAYRDFGDETNLEVGYSYARGYNPQPGLDTESKGVGFITQLHGMDATLRWKPLRRAIYRSFLWRNEFIWSNREQLPTAQRAFGMYSAAEYRLNRRWTAGGRFDRSGRAREAALVDKGASVILTYWPSEFSQVRAQYRFARYAENKNGNELRVQFLFSLGAHGAHPF